jgi:hypothetical protein
MKVLEFFPIIRYYEIPDEPFAERIEPYEEWAMSVIRAERNKRLTESDWRVLPDSPILNKQEWYEYRQALRDFPELVQVQQFNNVSWPIPPS